MRLSHQFPPSHHNARIMAAFAEDVKARSQGAVDVQVFPAEQLAKANENFPGVARGAFEAAAAVNFQWGTTIPEMNAPTIPYLFTDYARIQRFPGSEAAKQLEGLLERRAVRNLMWLYTTRQSIFTSNRKPIVALADFQGLKIRGLNALTDHALSSVGAAPSAMPGPEVSPALQSGVLDAGLTDVSAAVSRRYYEIQKLRHRRALLLRHQPCLCEPALVERVLQPAHRTAIEAAARKAEEDQMQVTEDTADRRGGRRCASKRHDDPRANRRPRAETWRAAMQQPVMDAFLRIAPEGGRRSIELLRGIPDRLTCAPLERSRRGARAPGRRAGRGG
jgi:TRAP-type C4-dicarboxylate transport system substrate-binding protein